MRGRHVFLPLLAAASLVAAPTRAQDSARVDTLAPGVVHRRLWRASLGAAQGPWALHVVEVDLRRAELSIEAAHATGRLVGRRRTSDIARTLDSAWCSPSAGSRRVLAAVNGDLFDLKTGENEGNQVVAGVVLKAGPTTDSPFDRVDNAHAQFAIDARGRPLLERFAFDGRLLPADGRPLRLDGVNARRGGAAVLYTPAVGATTPRDSAADAARGARHEAPYVVRARRGDTLWLRRAAPARAGGGTPIPPNGVVLSVADSAEAARALAVPGALAAVLRFAPDRGPLRTLIGGWGRLLADGEPVAARADSAESILDSFSHKRHPRTVVGFSRDSTTLFLITVDGRRATSVGMTLAELADAVRALGAWDAMNLDGGGSAAMVAGGRLVNVPSDSVGERTVGNALLVVRRERRADCAR